MRVEAQCGACGGGGLYVGLAERDGAAVVCSRCKGTGCMTVEYTPFKMRKTPLKGVTRVFEVNPGIVIGLKGPSGPYTLADFGGMPLKEWEAGMPFPPRSENRQFTCPAWWYQGADYSKKPDWDECRNAWGCSFSDCAEFEDKAACWKRWDEENKGE